MSHGAEPVQERGRHFVLYVKKHLKKHESPNSLISREDGKRQGGTIVMVFLGLSYKGKETPHFVPTGVGINGGGVS